METQEQREKRIALAQALLNQDEDKLLEMGVLIINDSAPVDQDCYEFVFLGSEHAHGDFLYTEQLDSDQSSIANIVAYAILNNTSNADGNAMVVHIAEFEYAHFIGEDIAISKISGSPLVIAHPVDLPPVDVPGTLITVWHRK